MDDLNNKILNIFSVMELLKGNHENLSSFVTKMTNSIIDLPIKSNGSCSDTANSKTVNAITLRSEKQIERPSPAQDEKKKSMIIRFKKEVAKIE